MLKLKVLGVDPVEDLIVISDTVGKDIKNEKIMSYASIREDYGRGKITATKFSDNIATLVFDGIFNDELELSLVGDASNSIDFIFCLEGYARHKFGSKSAFKDINFRQNSIVCRNNKSQSVIGFPADVPLKISIITYKPASRIAEKGETKQFRDMALNIISDMCIRDNYQYLGRVCFKTAKFVDSLINYSLSSSSDILFKEAALINTLACQIERHDLDSNGTFAKAPIRQSEIDRIISLENFIGDNLGENLSIERLQRISGLNPAKLQMGFNYLYNKSVNSYITEKRLEKAVSLIKSRKDVNVSELVYSVGLSSRSYFSKIFKRHYGILPSKVIANPQILLN